MLASAVLAAWPAAHAVPAPPVSPVDQQLLEQSLAGKGAAPQAWCDRVVELSAQRRSGVVTARLSNGVVVHHRRLERASGQVDVTITLQGGESLEDATTRGLTQVAAALMDDAAATAPGAWAAERMDQRDAHVDASAAADALQLRLWGAAADLGPLLGVAAELLTSPRITPEAVGAAREAALIEIARRTSDARAVVGDAVVDAIFPRGEVRARPVEERHVRGVTPERVREWIDRHARTGGATIEIGVAGDVTLAEALRAVDARLGGLPAREPPSRLAIENPPARPDAPVRVETTSPRVGRRAAVVRGCFGPDLDQTEDLRALRVAARVLAERLKKKLVPPAFTPGPDAPGASVLLSAYPGFCMLAASATPEDDQADRAGREIDEELARLAEQGPEQDEVVSTAEALAKMVESFERDPRYWSGMLSRTIGLGLDPDMVVDGPSAYRAMDPARVRAVLAKYLTPRARVSVTVRPVGE